MAIYDSLKAFLGTGSAPVKVYDPSVEATPGYPPDRTSPLNDAQISTIVLQELGGTNTSMALTETIPSLVSRYSAIRVYEDMMRSDAQTRIVLWSCKLPILSGQWYVEPYDDSQACKDHAAFLEDNMHGMVYPWIEFLLESLRCLEYGFSVFEKVFEFRTWYAPQGQDRAHSKPQQKLMWKKLAPRPAITVPRFIYDMNGGPFAIEHNIPDPNSMVATSTLGMTEIPINKAIVFTWDKHGGDLSGTPILRSAYKHWFYKDKFYLIDAIQKERHATGIPYAAIPPGADTESITNAANMLRNIRTNANAFFMKPPGWEMGFEEVQVQLVNALSSAEHHDMMLARNVLVQFINIGASASGGGSSGSRASGATMADLFQKSCKAIAAWHVENINRFAVKQLLDFNFANMNGNYPTVKVRGVADNRDFQTIASALGNFQKGGFITADKETEDFWREEMDMPKKLGPRPDGSDWPQGSMMGGIDEFDKQQGSGTGVNGTGNIPKGPRQGG